ncbi:MAG: hypothetical protein HY644_02665 [Acidobacteria bacterium]|nr:hypothetical protein [Acidobacteriota bacterium]
MAEKDKPQIQQARIRLVLKDLYPDYTIEFKNELSNFITFRIDDPNGYRLGTSGEYHSRVIADWSDEKLNNVIEQVVLQEQQKA